MGKQQKPPRLMTGKKVSGSNLTAGKGKAPGPAVGGKVQGSMMLNANLGKKGK